MAGTRTRPRGRLESDVMDVLWASSSPVSAKQIVERLAAPTPALTTVLTVLDRLEHKGRVTRSGEQPRGVLFAPTQSEAEHVSQTMLGALTTSHDRGAALLRFAGDLGTEDLSLLREALEAPRRTRGEGSR